MLSFANGRMMLVTAQAKRATQEDNLDCKAMHVEMIMDSRLD